MTRAVRIVNNTHIYIYTLELKMGPLNSYDRNVRRQSTHDIAGQAVSRNNSCVIYCSCGMFFDRQNQLENNNNLRASAT